MLYSEVRTSLDRNLVKIEFVEAAGRPCAITFPKYILYSGKPALELYLCDDGTPIAIDQHTARELIFVLQRYVDTGELL